MNDERSHSRLQEDLVAVEGKEEPVARKAVGCMAVVRDMDFQFVVGLAVEAAAASTGFEERRNLGQAIRTVAAIRIVAEEGTRRVEEKAGRLAGLAHQLLVSRPKACDVWCMRVQLRVSGLGYEGRMVVSLYGWR